MRFRNHRDLEVEQGEEERTCELVPDTTLKV